MKAINVSRVSTEEQKEAGNSLPAQIERIRKYCGRKGFEVAEKDIFSFDESAYKEKRDDFDGKVLARIEEIIKKEITLKVYLFLLILFWCSIHSKDYFLN